jgi:cation transport regulator ChaB
MDEYLSDLEGRWSSLLDEKVRRNLVSDIQAMLRDNLRMAIKVYKTKQLSQASLEEIAETLISRTPGLQHLGSRRALSLYMQMYMVKLLINFKI